MGTRPRPESLVTGASVLLLSVLILLPLGVLVIRSLGEPWSLDLFEQAFTNPRLRAVLQNTIVVSILSTGFAVVVGVTLAWLTHRARMPLAGFFDVMIIVPFFISPIVLAMTWLAVAGPSGLLNVILRNVFGDDVLQIRLESLTGITFIMGVYLVPYVYLYASIGLKNIDSAYEEASYTLGEGTLRTMLRVTLPLATPSILAGTLLAFVIAVSHFSIPLVLGRPHGIYVLTTIIYEMINFFPPDFAQAAAISLILLSISALGVWGQRSVLRRRSFVTVTGKARQSGVRRGGLLGVAGTVICGAYVVFIVIMPLATLTVVSCMSYFTFEGPRFTFAPLSVSVLRSPPHHSGDQEQPHSRDGGSYLYGAVYGGDRLRHREGSREMAGVPRHARDDADRDTRHGLCGGASCDLDSRAVPSRHSANPVDRVRHDLHTVRGSQRDREPGPDPR